MKKNISIPTLTASDGKRLTNGEVYTTQVYLGVNDSADNWHETEEKDVPKPIILEGEEDWL